MQIKNMRNVMTRQNALSYGALRELSELSTINGRQHGIVLEQI